MNITRQYSDEDIRIYRRDRGHEISIPLYFEYDVKKEQTTGREFKSRTQIVSYLKKLNKI